MMNSNITVIIPVHKLDTETDIELLKLAVSSVEKQKTLPSELIISCAVGLEKKLKPLFKDSTLNIRYLSNVQTDFQTQLNDGVASAKTEWVTFLESDDEMSTIWLNCAERYISKKTDIDIFLPIVVDVNNDNTFLGFTNEVVWANQFSAEMGQLDLDTLKDYHNFNIDGMVIKKSVYENLGGLKSSIKLTFIYEFLLRVLYNGVKIMTIPKIGYKHVNNRDNSLFHSYKTMDKEEVKFWQDLALKEFYHINDRKIKYEKSEA